MYTKITDFDSGKSGEDVHLSIRRKNGSLSAPSQGTMGSDSTQIPMSQGEVKDLSTLLPSPPPTPRKGNFNPSRNRRRSIWLFILWIVVLSVTCAPIIACLIATRGDHHPSKKTYVTVLFIAMGVNIVIVTLWIVDDYLDNRDEEPALSREQSLFAKGIPALATVSFIGITRKHEMESLFCYVVEWSFVVDDTKYSRMTPRTALPNAVVGDKFWVLYEDGNPFFVKRWALYDENGNIRGFDNLKWSKELSVKSKLSHCDIAAFAPPSQLAQLGVAF